jgi:hypothetical protein
MNSRRAVAAWAQAVNLRIAIAILLKLLSQFRASFLRRQESHHTNITILANLGIVTNTHLRWKLLKLKMSFATEHPQFLTVAV